MKRASEPRDSDRLLDVHEAAALLAPEAVDALPPQELATLIAILARAQACAVARLATAGVARQPHVHHDQTDRLLDVREAATRLGMSADWLYRNKNRLPFTRRLGRAVRFSSPASPAGCHTPLTTESYRSIAV